VAEHGRRGLDEQRRVEQLDGGDVDREPEAWAIALSSRNFGEGYGDSIATRWSWAPPAVSWGSRSMA
jgi:hypothetical protein